MTLQVQQLTVDLATARETIKEAEDANAKAVQQIQKSAAALDSCRSELQDTQEQVRQLQVGLFSCLRHSPRMCSNKSVWSRNQSRPEHISLPVADGFIGSLYRVYLDMVCCLYRRTRQHASLDGTSAYIISCCTDINSLKVLQSALNSEAKGRDEDKAAAAAALQQQLAVKDKDLQQAAQQLAAAKKQNQDLKEAGKKQSADAHAAALSEAAERLSQAQHAHTAEMKNLEASHAKRIVAVTETHQREVAALQEAKAKVHTSCSTAF